LREERRKIDGGTGRRLDELDVLSVAAADELMDREFESRGIDVATELNLKVNHACLTEFG
jgi:hypothetical protein